MWGIPGGGDNVLNGQTDGPYWPKRWGKKRLACGMVIPARGEAFYLFHLSILDFSKRSQFTDD